jgi:hypothetical protein
MLPAFVVSIGNVLDIAARQASLRRAVSTAYYARFHLLISEATLNWRRVEYRNALARVFEHGKMKNVRRKKMGELAAYYKTDPRAGSELAVAQHLAEGLTDIRRGAAESACGGR